MSSYLVENETIDRIISWLEVKNNGVGKSNLPPVDTMSEEEKQDLGKSMLKMNCEALIARYGQAEHQELFCEEYQYSFQPVSKMQALKSLSCFLYQCLEGEVPNSELFQRLKNIKNDLAMNIISDMPEYEKAIWG